MVSFNKLKPGFDQDDIVTFGKHAGNTWFWVMENAPDYIIWCVGNTNYTFDYKLIVDSIKSKYKIKKANKTEEVDGVYDPTPGQREYNNKYHSSVPSLAGKTILGRAIRPNENSNDYTAPGIVSGEMYRNGYFDDLDDDIPF